MYFVISFYYRIPAYFLRLTARFLGIRWTVQGLENVDDSRGAVVLLNHQSSLDLYGKEIQFFLKCHIMSFYMHIIFSALGFVIKCIY